MVLAEERNGPLQEARLTQRKGIGTARLYLKTKQEERNILPSLPIVTTANYFFSFMYSPNVFNQKRLLGFILEQLSVLKKKE